MGKINLFQKNSIKTAFAATMFIGIVSALLLSLFFAGVCQWWASELYKKIQFEVSDTKIVIEFGQTGEFQNKGGIYHTQNHLEGLTPMEQTMYNILTFMSIAVYDKKDELGNLCASFEKMRQALQEGNEEMWQQMEERKRLNAAFSHDLRTPLTVLKGQSELLRQYAPRMTAEKVRDTSEMMYRHIIRLEEYVQTMGELQRMEDIEIVRQPVTMDALCRQFRETGEAVCDGKVFSYEVIGSKHERLHVDTAIVLRVFENLLANAVRFAKEEITVSAESQDGYLYLAVSDDGTGFAEKDLKNATKPFYKTVRETDNGHFGMGLNICKILCERHGGYIRLSNQKGAVVTAAFRQ